MNRFDYIVPESLDAALKAQGKEPLVLKAAGIDLLDRLKEGLEEPAKVLSIGALEELAFIKEEGAGLRMGALTTLADMGRSALLKARAPSLHDAASSAATPQIRERATLGGNLCQRPRCWYFRNKDFNCWKKGGDTCFAVEGENQYHAVMGGGPCFIVHPSNCAVPLVALQARFVVKGSDHEREIAAKDFFVPPAKSREQETVLEPGEVVTEVILPQPALASATIELREKQSFDWPVALASVARFEEGWNVCMGAVAPVPWLSEAAGLLLGQVDTVDEALAEKVAGMAVSGATPLSGNGYKVKLARVAVKRALLKASGEEVGV